MSLFSTIQKGIGIGTTLTGAYNTITKTQSLPEAVGAVLGAVDTIKALTGKNNTTHVQGSNVDVEKGAFKWAEMMTEPESFATSDSALIFAGDPYYLNNTLTQTLVPIGMCQGFSYSGGVNVTPIHELRCEELIVLPGKTQPGQITISRLCGDYASLVNRLHGIGRGRMTDDATALGNVLGVDMSAGWNFSTHTDTFRSLFGLLVVFYSERRSKQLASLYFERCAITNVSLGVQAGSYQILDNVSIVCGRCINPDSRPTYAPDAQDSYVEPPSVGTAQPSSNSGSNTNATVENSEKRPTELSKDHKHSSITTAGVGAIPNNNDLSTVVPSSSVNSPITGRPLHSAATIPITDAVISVSSSANKLANAVSDKRKGK